MTKLVNSSSSNASNASNSSSTSSTRSQFRFQPYQLPEVTNNNIGGNNNNNNNNEQRNRNDNHINNNNEQWVIPIGLARQNQQRDNAEERVRLAEEELLRIEAEEAAAVIDNRQQQEQVAVVHEPVAVIDNEQQRSNRERWVIWLRARGLSENDDIQTSMYLRMEDEFIQELIRVNNEDAGQGRRVDDIRSDLHRVQNAMEVYAGDCLFVRTCCIFQNSWTAWRLRNNISKR